MASSTFIPGLLRSHVTPSADHVASLGMAQTAASGLAFGLSVTAVEPRSRRVTGSPGATPSIRKYHQHGQPRAASPPGVNAISRAVWSMLTTLTDAPSKSLWTVSGSARATVATITIAASVTKDRWPMILPTM
jgi:hypothetical protein